MELLIRIKGLLAFYIKKTEVLYETRRRQVWSYLKITIRLKRVLSGTKD